jgi:hypothetical protein
MLRDAIPHYAPSRMVRHVGAVSAGATVCPTARVPRRMRPRIGKPIPLRRTPTQMPTLIPRSDPLHRARTEPGPQILPMRLATQHPHHLMHRIDRVNRPTHLRQLQLHAMLVEQRQQLLELPRRERSLELLHHDRIERTLRAGDRSQQRRRLRPL